MSGHSKWSTIKRKKAITDAKKASIFTRFGRAVAVAAKEGGNPETNFKLKLAIDQAKSVNMPKENIERAIKKGIGKIKDGQKIEEVVYEAYGPGNVAMLIKTATENKKRTISELKNILNKTGGKLVSEGSVKFLFKKIGSIDILIAEGKVNELELEIIDVDIEDIVHNGDVLTFHTKAENLQKIKEKIGKKDIKIVNSVLTYIPIQKIKITESDKKNYDRLAETLSNQDDVQEIYDNVG